MKTTELITVLSNYLASHGDLDVQIESSHGEYSPCEIRWAKPVMEEGIPMMLLASDEADDGLRFALSNAKPSK
jgi:hypothetical protein